MNGFSKRTETADQPAPLKWGARLGLSLLALLTLAMITAVLAPAIGASWWIVAVHVTLATCGACFLLLLFLLHVAQPNESKQRQFSLRQALIAMFGLGLMLTGIGGIFRLAHFDPSRTTWNDWLVLIFALASIFLIGSPLLSVLLETVVAVVNAAIRRPIVRRLLRRPAHRDGGSGEP